MIGSTMTLVALAAAPAALSEVRECGDLRPLKWQTWLHRNDVAEVFTQEHFLPQTEWRGAAGDTTGGALVRECFGTGTPHGRDVVVHYYPPAAFTPRRVRPVLLVTGAGDNALRSMSFLAVSLSHQGFHSYSLTFAHRHGDNFQHAEQVAGALSWIGTRHPGVKVDVIAYSKGAMAARIHASHVEGTSWGGAHRTYTTRGTHYRGDMGRLFLVGAPNAGTDMVFRWPAANLFAAQGQALDAPTSWTRYYPYTTGNPFVSVDLEATSIYDDFGDAFPGQAQMLADLREVHALPGGNLGLGVYANQPDWYTTYEGGVGFVSESRGIEEALDDGGRVIEHLQRAGVAPDVELYLVAGGNPILGIGSLDADLLEAGWGDLGAAQRRVTWEDLVESWVANVFPWWAGWNDDLPRLLAGTAFLGEISGPSDGVVFVHSALDDTGLTRRGAHVVERKLFEALSHPELVAAGTLAATFYGDPEIAGGLYDPDLAAKYGREENQVIEWIIRVLSGPVPEAPPEPTPSPSPSETATASPSATPRPTASETPAPSATPPVEELPPGPPASAPPDDGPADPEDLAPLRGPRFSGSCASGGTGGGAVAGAILLTAAWRARRRRMSRSKDLTANGRDGRPARAPRP